MPRSSIYKWLRGDAVAPLLDAAILCGAAGRPIDWLVGLIPPPRSDGLDYALIPRLEVEASAGGGALAAEEDVGGMIAFRSEWLRRVGISPRSARALRARGDSMEPTIRDGDILLIDTSIDRLVDEGIYVVVVGGLVLVKRLAIRRDGTVILKSDNAERYDEEVIPPAEAPDLAVSGRVMWFGRSI